MDKIMNLNDFVFVKEGAFTPEFCDSIINDFESYKSQGLTRSGQSGMGVNHDVKNSTDMNLLEYPELAEKYNNTLNEAFNHILTNEYLGGMPYQEEFDKNMLFYSPTFYELFQVQKYNQNQGHYNGWHAETGDFQMSRRLFVFILYLNDVTEGGETELLYTRTKTQPKKGSLLIHPASYPFVHKGHVPVSNDKYILTTWLSYVPS